ncbi:MAG TPA: PEGA domain-containing protein [Polyangia bacterium]|jgi:tetratricopeptide (TPR) repeat protein
MTLASPAAWSCPTSTLAALTLALAALTAALPARAQPAADAAAQARHEFFVGEAYYRNGDYQQAIIHYQRAHALKPHPAVLYNVAQCFERLGQLDHASEQYERYLREHPAAADRAEVAARVARFRRLPSRVAISSDPAGAAVAIDGETRGVTPLVLELPPGDHRVEVRLGDRPAQAQPLRCAHGRPAYLSFSLAAPPGRLVVRPPNGEGAEVRLDGELVGYAPYESELAAGRHLLEIGLAGCEPVRRFVTVVAGATASFALPLRRRAGADAIAVLTDGPDPFTLVRRAVQGRLEAEGFASWIVGGLGGAHARSSTSYDTGIGGLVLGIEFLRRADLHLDLLAPAPVQVSMGSRIYLTTGRVRPFVKVGWTMGSRRKPDRSGRWFGMGLEGGGGLAVDATRWLVLFGQVSVVYAGDLNYTVAESDLPHGYLQVPVLFGACLRL